jgi:hypothetical protein
MGGQPQRLTFCQFCPASTQPLFWSRTAVTSATLGAWYMTMFEMLRVCTCVTCCQRVCRRERIVCVAWVDGPTSFGLLRGRVGVGDPRLGCSPQVCPARSRAAAWPATVRRSEWRASAHRAVPPGLGLWPSGARAAALLRIACAPGPW